MAILLSSRYISDKKVNTDPDHIPGENEEVSGSQLRDLLKQKAAQYK